jgi:serine/threonine-protein kinase
MPPDTSNSRPRQGDLIGGYRLEALLGEGGMGSVFRAVREPAGDVVALKVLRADLAEDDVYVRRFEREGRIAAGLVHPHLVSVLDAGSADGRRYLVTRYVEGVPLSDVLAEGPLSGGSVVRLAAGIGSALDGLHRRGLVHRDVKPGNILVEGDGHSLLTDFGVARGEADSVLTKAGRVVGTVDYLAPEVIRGEPASAASDVYSLGCVVHASLAGRPPCSTSPRRASPTCSRPRPTCGPSGGTFRRPSSGRPSGPSPRSPRSGRRRAPPTPGCSAPGSDGRNGEGPAVPAPRVDPCRSGSVAPVVEDPEPAVAVAGEDHRRLLELAPDGIYGTRR